MHIISIGTKLDLLKDHVITVTDLFSNSTFLDADIIFWDVSYSYSIFSYKSENDNEVDLSRFSYLKELLNKRQKEFTEFFNLGRTLVIINPFFKDIPFTVNEGAEAKKQYLNFQDCIELENLEFERADGKNIDSIQQSEIKSFLNNHNKRLSYSIKYTNNSGYPLMFIKGTKYIVSKFYKKNKGIIILFPQFKFLTPDSREKSDFVEGFEMLIQGIKKIPTNREVQIPDWVDNFVLINEAKERNKLTKLEEQQIELLERINSQKDILSEFKEIKALFSTDGKTLEFIVEKVLVSLGFSVEQAESNRDDLIIKTENKVAVVEIKGSTKSAAEKHCAQLQKWVTNYHLEKGINPKGILIINTFKDRPIDERTELDFPNQMIPYAKQMQHCLVTSLQLLCIFLDLKYEKTTKDKIIDLLFSTIGELKYTKAYKNYFNKY